MSTAAPPRGRGAVVPTFVAMSVVIGALAGCSDATGSVRGGASILDASVPEPPPVAADAGRADAGPVTFTELYDTIFGPNGKASCAGDGQCHGASDQPGALATAGPSYPMGYVCAPDKDACYRNMTGAGLPSTAGNTAPEQTTLYLILRKSTGGGSMPKRPASVSMTPDEMQRIRDWIAGGGKND